MKAVDIIIYTMWLLIGVIIGCLQNIETENHNPQKRIEFIMIDTANCGDELGEVDTIYYNGIKIFKEI